MSDSSFHIGVSCLLLMQNHTRITLTHIEKKNMKSWCLPSPSAVRVTARNSLRLQDQLVKRSMLNGGWKPWRTYGRRSWKTRRFSIGALSSTPGRRIMIVQCTCSSMCLFLESLEVIQDIWRYPKAWYHRLIPCISWIHDPTNFQPSTLNPISTVPPVKKAVFFLCMATAQQFTNVQVQEQSIRFTSKETGEWRLKHQH